MEHDNQRIKQQILAHDRVLKGLDVLIEEAENAVKQQLLAPRYALVLRECKNQIRYPNNTGKEQNNG